MHILIIEDEAKVAKALRTGLETEGYEVTAAATGEDGYFLATTRSFDLVVLDLMLPGLDGSYVLEHARREGFTAPVIILSARSSVEDRIRGLRTGADDYVVKPFDLGELLARIAVRLRRQSAVELARFGDVVVDPESRVVSRGGEEVHLTPKEFDLLLFFIGNPYRALARGRILEEVWGTEYRGTRRTVDNFVRALRLKLEEVPDEPRFFHTVRARGYRFSPRG